MNCSPLVGLRNQTPAYGEYFYENSKFSDRGDIEVHVYKAKFNNAYRKGEPFLRDGKIDEIPIDPDKTTQLSVRVNRPDMEDFMPRREHPKYPWGTSREMLTGPRSASR